ncbi:4Fe-4S ferredoxin, partial [bacterium]|nr:4Fe-4S ferredoxin [bacterium]
MSTPVYLLRFQHSDPIDQTKNRLKKLFKTAGFDKIIEKNDVTAVKVHFGEPGNTSYLPHHYVEPIV